MEDILGDIVNNNINIIIEENKIICYSAKNIIVTKTLSEFSGLICDLCNIIAEYYNAIIINQRIVHYLGVNVFIEDEYINFKKINCRVTLFHYNFNDWWFINSYI